MWGKCLLGKWLVNICNLSSHFLFLFGHPEILVDSISECTARCVSEMLMLLLGGSQASFCLLLPAVLGAQGWVWCLLRVPQLLGAAGVVPTLLHARIPLLDGFAAWLLCTVWLSGLHFYLVSWPACPGKLPSPGLWWSSGAGQPFPSLFSPSHTWCLLAPTVYLSLSLCLPLIS